MALTRIQYGGDVASGVLNDNFEYLDDRITDVGSSISTVQSNLASVSSTLNGRINNLDFATPQDLEDAVTELEASIGTVDDKVDSINYAPDYSKAVGISIPYTVLEDGWISIYMRGAWGGFATYVNSQMIAYVEGATDNRFTNGNVNTFMVSAGDTITTTGNVAGAWFYPMKGDE